jgi:hypothetical protein
MRRFFTRRPSGSSAHAIAEFALVCPLLFFTVWALSDLGILALRQMHLQWALAQTARDIALLAEAPPTELERQAALRLNRRLAYDTLALTVSPLPVDNDRAPLRAREFPELLILNVQMSRDSLFPFWRSALPEGHWKMKARAVAFRLARRTL